MRTRPFHAFSIPTQPWRISLVATGLLLVLTLGAMALLYQEIEAELRGEAQYTATHMQAHGDKFVGKRILGLRAVQAYFDASLSVTKAEYDHFVKDIVTEFKGTRAINVIDASDTVRWVSPLKGNEQALNLCLRGLEGEAPLRRALQTSKTQATDPLTLKEGGRGFLLFVPLREKSGKWKALVTVADLRLFRHALWHEPHSKRFEMRLEDSRGRVLYQSGILGPYSVSVPLSVADKTWRLHVGRNPNGVDYLPILAAWALGGLLWLGALWYIWSDVFASARLAREVSARTEELRTSRDQLEVILNGVADGIFVLAPPDGRAIYVNDAAVIGLGFESAEAMRTASQGERTQILKLADEEGRPLPLEQVPSERALRGEAVRGTLLRHQRPTTGEERMVLVKANPIFDEQGQVRFAIVIFNDITQRVRLERQLTVQLAELQALDRLKNDFLNVVTHELRTPLTSIRGFAEFLEDGIGGELSPENQEFVRHIQLSALQLGGLVDDLLDLARLEAGKFTLKLQPVEVNGLAREVVDSFRPQAKEGDLELIYEGPEQPVWTLADPLRVRQIITNVLSNALKFTLAGGTVGLSLTVAGEELTLRVRDTGIGIQPDHLPRLFSKFYQVESALNRTYKGTGLGLTITKGLVEAHGGHIELESILEQGTTVTVVLPCRRPASVEQGVT